MRDGLGPYLSIYLLLTHHWDQASIGLVMGIGGLAAIAAQTPVGAARRAGPDARDRAVQRQPGRAHHHVGVGAALSKIIAGWIVVAAGYDAAFISLGVFAAAGLALYATAMPETGPNAAGNGGLAQASGLPRTGEMRG